MILKTLQPKRKDAVKKEEPTAKDIEPAGISQKRCNSQINQRFEKTDTYKCRNKNKKIKGSKTSCKSFRKSSDKSNYDNFGLVMQSAETNMYDKIAKSAEKLPNKCINPIKEQKYNDTLYKETGIYDNNGTVLKCSNEIVKRHNLYTNMNSNKEYEYKEDQKITHFIKTSKLWKPENNPKVSLKNSELALQYDNRDHKNNIIQAGFNCTYHGDRGKRKSSTSYLEHSNTTCNHFNKMNKGVRISGRRFTTGSYKRRLGPKQFSYENSQYYKKNKFEPARQANPRSEGTKYPDLQKLGTPEKACVESPINPKSHSSNNK